MLVIWKKIIFRLRFSLFRLLSLVALCCSWFMSKGSSENLIKYFIFLSSQVNKYWSGRLQSQNLARRHKRTVTCNGTVLVLLLHFSLQFSAEKFKNYNSWAWAWFVILLPLLIVMVIYYYYYYYYLLLLLLLFVIRPVLQLLPHTTANHQNSLRFCFCFLFELFL